MLRHNIRLYVVSCSLSLASSARTSFLSPTYPAKHPHIPTKTKAIRYPTSYIRTNARNRNIIKIATPVLRGSDDGVDEDSKEQSYKKESKMKILSPFVSVFSAAALFSIGCTLWSEYTVIMTGCGPMLLPDVVERSCYLGVLVIAGSSVFLRIVTGNGLAAVIESSIDSTIPNRDTITLQIRSVEYLSLLVVCGAFISLGAQIVNGEQMDGLSGINEDMCKAMQQL